MRLVEGPHWLGSAVVLLEVPGRFEEKEGLVVAEFAVVAALVAAALVVGVGAGIGKEEQEQLVPECTEKDDALVSLLLAAGAKGDDGRCSARPSQRRW